MKGKNKMKKIVALILALVLACACFAACSAEDGKITDEANTGSAEIKDVAASAVLDEVKNVLGEYYGADADIPAEILADTYGIKAEWVEEYAAQMPMISFRIDTYMVIKAKDGHAEDVEKALTDYHTYQVENSMQYPVNVPKLKAAKVARLGDYVLFILTGYVPDEYMDDEEGAFKYAADNNQMVIDKVEEFLTK